MVHQDNRSLWSPNHNIQQKGEATHLGSTDEMVRPFTDNFWSLLEIDLVLITGLIAVNAGCFGEGRAASSLPSIETTSDMAGRSFGFSSMQRSPMLMHLNGATSGGQPSDGSISSSARFEFQSSQALHPWIIIFLWNTCCNFNYHKTLKGSWWKEKF